MTQSGRSWLDRFSPEIDKLFRFRLKHLALSFLAVALWQSAEACQFDPQRIFLRDPVGQMNRHDFTFRGQIVAVDQNEMTAEEFEYWVDERGEDMAEIRRKMAKKTMSFAFRVDKVWKGQVSEAFVAVYKEPLCSTRPTPGDTYIVFGKIDEEGNSHALGFIREAHFAEIEPKLDRGY